MDPEKSAAWTGRGSEVDKINRAQYHNNDLPSWAATQDPEKNGEFGQNLHTAQQDVSRKESVEIPDLRFSMASDDGSLEDLDRQRQSIGQRLSVHPHPPSRGESIRTQASGTSLPQLMRRETKLAQKKAHPWYVETGRKSNLSNRNRY
jgi:hypothetical protein